MPDSAKSTSDWWSSAREQRQPEQTVGLGRYAGLRVAIVHEWLDTYAGSERVLEQLLLCFPDADLFAVVDFMSEAERGFLKGRKISDVVDSATALRATYVPPLPRPDADRNPATQCKWLRPYYLQQSRRRQRRAHWAGSDARELRALTDALRLGPATPVFKPGWHGARAQGDCTHGGCSDGCASGTS